MSLLVKSNASESAKTRLQENEVLGAMSHIMSAGHETTASTTTFALWELSKHPLVQERLRTEIREFYQAALDRGETCIPVTEYDKMTYTQAVMKETLRFDSLLPHQFRSAAKDIIVPLSEPVRTRDGRCIQEIPLKKGTRVLISITQYNRHPELWGQDAQVWNPDRWLKKDGIDDSIKYGVLANL